MDYNVILAYNLSVKVKSLPQNASEIMIYKYSNTAKLWSKYIGIHKRRKEIRQYNNESE